MTDKKVKLSEKEDKTGIINYGGNTFVKATMQEKVILDSYQRITSSMVTKERDRQNSKWGHQINTNGDWMCILIEEIGEASQAINKLLFSGKDSDKGNLIEELIQASAVCQAWAEQLLREQDRGDKFE